MLITESRTAAQKTALRKKMRELNRSLTAAEKARQSQVVFAAIERSPAWRKANRVMLFSSLSDELPTHEVVERWRQSKQVYLPRVNNGSIEAVLHNGELSRGAFNILEPTGHLTSRAEDLDLIVVPAMALDRKGNRLGRGKGCYDKLLAKAKNATTIGVAFKHQLAHSVPALPHDIKLHHVVTADFCNLPQSVQQS